MLVCGVVLRPRRTVAAIIAEAGAAIDTPNTLGLGQLVVETASAADVVNAQHIGLVSGTITEAASADTAQDGAVVAAGGAARSTMVGTVFVNSDGTPRQANANGVMVNL